VVSFTTWLLYLPGKETQYPFNRRLGGHQSKSGHVGVKRKNILGPAGNQTQVIYPIAQSLYCLSYPGSPVAIRVMIRQ